MIVAPDLEDDRPAVADVDRARVLARPLQDVRAGLRQGDRKTHGIEIDYDIFESLQPPNPPPTAGNCGKTYETADLNFTLKAGRKAVDAGVKIPNVNDGFAGRAPDLGAYEVGQPLPVY